MNAYGIKAEVVADSVSEGGARVTTMCLKYPRFILAEFNTHRQFSRNSASSRAIPTRKLIDQLRHDPVLPVQWGRNRPGMQASESLDYAAECVAKSIWVSARDAAIRHVEDMEKLGVHKQVINRILEPYVWAYTVVTATEWDNFFALRLHPDAQPEIRCLAERMQAAMSASKPKEVDTDSWHMPYAENVHGTHEESLYASVARCARVSYMTHEGRATTPEQNKKLHDRLRDNGHWSPFEHQAQPLEPNVWSGNFKGWRQYRHVLFDQNMR